MYEGNATGRKGQDVPPEEQDALSMKPEGEEQRRRWAQSQARDR